MRKRLTKPKEFTLSERFPIGVMGLGLIAIGTINIMQGKLTYLNYSHAPVFFPFVILIGVLVFALAFARMKK